MAKNKDVTIEITPIVFATLATIIGIIVIVFGSQLSDTAKISGFGLAGSLAAGGAGIAPVTNSNQGKKKEEEKEEKEEKESEKTNEE